MGRSSQKQALQNRPEILESASRLLRKSGVAAPFQVRVQLSPKLAMLTLSGGTKMVYNPRRV